MTKVVINKCYGGFSLSKEGMQRYCEIKNIPVWIEDDTKFKSLGLFTVWKVALEARFEQNDKEFYSMTTEQRIEYNRMYSEQTISNSDIPRDDSALVQLVEENSELYSGRHAELCVVEIPDDVAWEIEEYDGNEHIAEQHRTWY